MPDVISDPAEFRAALDDARARGHRVGLVPTMGALHEGHLSLIDKAKERADRVAVTIFVNPTQFAPTEDLDKYPRPFEEDVRLCGERGADLVFAPTNDAMYAPDASTWVDVEGLSEVLEGAHRPTHFRGVTTIVTKLLSLAGPCTACFGRKDYQQQLIIRRMVRDLFLPCEIVTVATVREPDGLALSSRNRYLSDEERARSLRLWQALCLAQERINFGEHQLDLLRDDMRNLLESGGGVEVDYVSLADQQTLAELAAPSDNMIALIAARVGSTRLIDNLPLVSPIEGVE